MRLHRGLAARILHLFYAADKNGLACHTRTCPRIARWRVDKPLPVESRDDSGQEKRRGARKGRGHPRCGRSLGGVLREQPGSASSELIEIGSAQARASIRASAVRSGWLEMLRRLVGRTDSLGLVRLFQPGEILLLLLLPCPRRRLGFHTRCLRSRSLPDRVAYSASPSQALAERCRRLRTPLSHYLCGHKH